MRVAIAHYWLLNMRGGEKVLEALCRILPQADLFTLFYEPRKVSEIIRSPQGHRVFLKSWTKVLSIVAASDAARPGEPRFARLRPRDQ
ncbi:MAG: hypothetical protein QM757_33615 [Paludibaculum sp.]